jgi:siroheme synthase
MGLSTLPDLARGLVAAGLDAATPAALIENGGTGCARRLDGTLLSIAFEAARWARGGPVLLLVGEVVALGAPAEPAARAARQPVPAIA